MSSERATTPRSDGSRDGVVGVIGLGAMGGRAAAALAASGRAVVGYDVDPAARKRAEEAGVRIAGGAAALTAGSAVVMLSLPAPADVLSAVDALGPSATGRLVVDLSTIDPATAREAAARLDAFGARYVEAPVLGRPSAVGSWVLVAGGQQRDVAETTALAVGTIAKSVERVGDVGAGSTVKVLNNLMFGAINAVTAEVLDLAERADLDPVRFVEVVAGSGAASVSPLFRDVAPRMAHGDHTPVFNLALLQKDLRLGATLARQLGAAAEVTTVVERLTSAAVELGHGRDDTSALIELHRARRRSLPES